MRRATVRSGVPLLLLIVLAAILTGCGSFSNKDILWGSRLGFRPDEPTLKVSTAREQERERQKAERDKDAIASIPGTSCDLLNQYIVYASNLKESYRTRATQNRSWIYVAAITGLGVAAASGALAAASAASAGTLALLAISGGFTAGAFATIDNSELANVYTVAANDIGAGLACTEGRITAPGLDCGAQLSYLTLAVTSARQTLETARTSSAAGALARATAQRKLLDQEITKAQQAKDAADKAEEAKKAKQESVVATNELKEAERKAIASPQDANAERDRKAAEIKANDKAKESSAKEKEAKDAEAKLKVTLSCPPLAESK